MKIAVITVSDRASKGLYKDESGPAIERILADFNPSISIEREVVPDGVDSVMSAFARHPDADWIITSGGTGPSPRDLTPEATEAYCDRMLPGFGEFFRAKSLEQTPFAVFSRASGGMKGPQFIVNFPGSVKGAEFHAALLLPLLFHGLAMAQGKGH